MQERCLTAPLWSPSSRSGSPNWSHAGIGWLHRRERMCPAVFSAVLAGKRKFLLICKAIFDVSICSFAIHSKWIKSKQLLTRQANNKEIRHCPGWIRSSYRIHFQRYLFWFFWWRRKNTGTEGGTAAIAVTAAAAATMPVQVIVMTMWKFLFCCKVGLWVKLEQNDDYHTGWCEHEKLLSLNFEVFDCQWAPIVWSCA